MRDYSKFLKDNDRLDVRLVPRPVYTQMVTDYRQQPEVIAEVFFELFWLWDLEERERKLAEEGKAVDRSAVAQEIIGEMDDNEWWKVMQAFETRFQEHFAECSSRWADLLDPIYDEQEAAGWIARQ